MSKRPCTAPDPGRRKSSRLSHSGSTTARKSGASNVVVAVRSRPLFKAEVESGQYSVVDCEPFANAVRISKAEKNGGVLRSERGQNYAYAYDHVFGPEAAQEDVYQRTTQPLLEEVRLLQHAHTYASCTRAHTIPQGYCSAHAHTHTRARVCTHYTHTCLFLGQSTTMFGNPPHTRNRLDRQTWLRFALSCAPS